MSKNHSSSTKATETSHIDVLLISNGRFNKREWSEHHNNIHREIQKICECVKLKMFHPNISCKKKLQEEFAVVIIDGCNAHLAKRYHRDIKAKNEKTIFFLLNPPENYNIEGVRIIENIQGIPFGEVG